MSATFALVLTLLVESVVGVGLWAIWQRRRPALELLAVLVAVSLITHPLAWAANEHWLRGWPFESRALLIETLVILVEAAILARVMPWPAPRRGLAAMVIAILMNLASFSAGMLWSGAWRGLSR